MKRGSGPGTSEENSTARLQSVQTTFQIIELLVSGDATSLSEIAAELNKPVSTVYGYLNTLLEEGYLTKSGREYAISTQFLYIGNKLCQEHPVYQASEPELRELADVTGEYVTLMIEENGYGVIIAQEKGENVQHVAIQRTHPGTRTHLHVTAPGRILLAFKPERERKSFLQSHELEPWTENTLTDPDALRSELEMIRRQGYAHDVEETMLRMQGIAGPILDEGNNRYAAVSVYGPTKRIESELDDIRAQVLECANMIELGVNYS